MRLEQAIEEFNTVKWIIKLIDYEYSGLEGMVLASESYYTVEDERTNKNLVYLVKDELENYLFKKCVTLNWHGNKLLKHIDVIKTFKEDFDHDLKRLSNAIDYMLFRVVWRHWGKNTRIEEKLKVTTDIYKQIIKHLE